MIKFKIQKLKRFNTSEIRYEVKLLKNNKLQHTIYLDTNNKLTKKEIISNTIEVLLDGYLIRFKETFVKLNTYIHIHEDNL